MQISRDDVSYYALRAHVVSQLASPDFRYVTTMHDVSCSITTCMRALYVLCKQSRSIA